MFHKAKAVNLGFPLLCCLLLLALGVPVSGQKIAILTPDRTGESQRFAEKLGEVLGETFRVLDTDLVRSAHAATATDTPFNMTAEESKRLGSAIGSDFFVLIRAANQPRSS